MSFSNCIQFSINLLRLICDFRYFYDLLLRVENRKCQSSQWVNSFLLSVCSPVLHKMLCGSFTESHRKKIILQDVDGSAFGKAFDIWCGKESTTELEMKDVKVLASVADLFQMTEVLSVLDETVLRHLDIRICGDVLSWCGQLGLKHSEVAARKLAAERFEELAKTEGFMRMDAEALGRLLDDDHISARNEETVWEAVTVWWGADSEEGQARRRGLSGLVERIRFPLMEEEYLRTRVVGMAPAEDAEWMEGIVAEALRAKAARASRRVDGSCLEFQLLGPKALDDREGLGSEWWKCADGGERRLTGHAHAVMAVAECDGRVCSGSLDGSIQVWSTMTDAPERRLVPDGNIDPVFALSVWEGRLISGHKSGKLRVWNVATGSCDQIFVGNSLFTVYSLVVSGSRLASGSVHKSISVWAMGPSGRWMLERTLPGHKGWIRSLAEWQGKWLSGSEDQSIRVWDVGTGAHDATLTGHDGAVMGLVVHGERLFSGSRDGTIRVWALGTWAVLRTVEAYKWGSGPFLRCLAVSGSQLVSGFEASGGQGGVLVWALETLKLQRRLPQPAGAGVMAILAVDGGVWAGVRTDLVVWGRRA